MEQKCECESIAKEQYRTRAKHDLEKRKEEFEPEEYYQQKLNEIDEAHHLLKAAHKVTGPIMWANLHLLFWLSLFPFVTGWMGENHFKPVPTALYGGVLFLAAIAYYILQGLIIADQGCDSKLAAAIGRDYKGKLSPVLYAIAIAASFFRPWIAGCIYVFVALMWLVPDRRIERALAKREKE